MFENPSSHKKWAMLVLSASGVMIHAVPATAQTTETTSAAGGLQEVVVTAQRKSESVQDVPVAITAVTASQLERAGITNIADLNQVSPGLRIATDIGAGPVYMRGVGSGNTSAGAEGDVGIYIDDVYYADPYGALMSLSNVERIEVLKGPQGTLYGRNAVGGLIHIITPDPQVAPLLKASVGYESYGAITTSVYATGGIERLQGSISVNTRHQDTGYGHYFGPPRDVAFPGEETNRQGYQNYRAKLSWEPTDADRITLSGNYFRNPSDFGLAGNIFPGSILFTGQTPLRTWDSGSFYGTQYSLTKDLALHWNHSFDNGSVLKSITAWRHVFYQNDLDLVIPLFSSAILKKDRSLQQEFLFQGKTNALLDRALEYTTGVFFFDMNTSPYYQTEGLTGPPYVPLLDTNQHNSTRSYAVYAQGDYSLTDRDTLTAGLRYTWDRQKFTNISSGVTAAPPAATFGEPTWRLALKHQLTDKWMVYTSWSRGYKSGLFDNSTIEADGSVNLLKPEFLSAYEAGTKGTFLNGYLQLGLNAFYWDYSNIQVEFFQGSQILLQNAGSAKIYGLEPEATVSVPVPVGNLELHTTTSFISNKYTRFEGCTINTPVTTFPPGGAISTIGSCSGNHLTNAPEQEYTVGANYKVDVPGIGGKVDLGVDFYHSGTVFFGADNTQKQPPSNTYNAQLAYELPDARTRLRLYGKNLSNEKVVAYAAQAFFGGFGIYNPPRVFGVELQYRFD